MPNVAKLSAKFDLLTFKFKVIEVSISIETAVYRSACLPYLLTSVAVVAAMCGGVGIGDRNQRRQPRNPALYASTFQAASARFDSDKPVDTSAKERDRPAKAYLSPSQRASFDFLKKCGTPLWRASGICKGAGCENGCTSDAHVIQYVATHLADDYSKYELRQQQASLLILRQHEENEKLKAEKAECITSLVLEQNKVRHLHAALQNSLGQAPTTSRISAELSAEQKAEHAAAVRCTILKSLGVKDQLAQLEHDIQELTEK